MFARTGKHLHTQQLTEKAAGYIIQILKPVPHAHCLSTVQDQRTARKSSLGMYGKTAKSFVRYRENGILGEQVLLTAACQEHEEDSRIPSQAGPGMWELFFCNRDGNTVENKRNFLYDG